MRSHCIASNTVEWLICLFGTAIGPWCRACCMCHWYIFVAAAHSGLIRWVRSSKDILVGFKGTTAWTEVMLYPQDRYSCRSRTRSYVTWLEVALLFSNMRHSRSERAQRLKAGAGCGDSVGTCGRFLSSDTLVVKYPHQFCYGSRTSSCNGSHRS